MIAPHPALGTPDPTAAKQAGELASLVAIGAMALVMVWLFAVNEWPLWPALACAVSGLAARAVGLHAARTVGWPVALSAVLGLVDAAVWVVLTRRFGAGLEPALPTLARAVLLPTLALGPVLAACWLGKARPYAIVQGAGLVLGACATLILEPVGDTGWVYLVMPATVAFATGVVPIVAALLDRCSPADPALVGAGLMFASCCGGPGLATLWAERQLRDPAIYFASKATVEDLQDAYAVFPARSPRTDLVMVRVAHADLRTGGDFQEAYSVTARIPPDANPRGGLFSAKPAPGEDLIHARSLTLTQIGTQARPLTTPPITLSVNLTRADAAFALWPTWYGAGAALLAAVLLAPWRSRLEGALLAPVLVGFAGALAWATPGRPEFAIALGGAPLIMRFMIDRRASYPPIQHLLAALYALLILDLGRG